MYSNIQSYPKKFTSKFWRQDAKRRNSTPNVKKTDSESTQNLVLDYDITEENNLIEEFKVSKKTFEAVCDNVSVPYNTLENSIKLRPIRTIKHSLIDNSEQINPVLDRFIASYTKNFSWIKSKYEGCNQCHLSLDYLSTEDAVDNEAPVYEIDQELEVPSSGDCASVQSDCQSLDSVDSDPLLTGLLNGPTLDTEEMQNLKLRQKNRQTKLFNLYLTQKPDKLIERTPNVDPPTEYVGKSIKVTVKSLKLEPDLEPIFGNMCLYDLKNRKKISENFYFDFNHASKFKMLDDSTQEYFLQRLPQANSCIFHINNWIDVFLVVRIEKILQQGDINEVADAYLKDEKHQTKLKTHIEWACKNLSRYRMPFGIMAIELQKVTTSNGKNPMEYQSSTSIDNCSFSSRTSVKSSRTVIKKQTLDTSSIKSASRSLSKDINLMPSSSIDDDDFTEVYSNIGTLVHHINNFYRQEPDKMSDEDLFKFLSECKKPSNYTKRQRSIACSTVIEITSISELNSTEFILSPEEIPLATKYQGLAVRSSKQPYTERPIMDILEFPAEKRFTVNAVYRNLLYVYPKSVNFSSRAGSLRNITIRVQLLQADEEKIKVLPAIYSKSNGRKLMPEAFSKVLYHNKNPDFNDEIKIQLPGIVTSKHFILFSFYHVSCQTNKKSDSSCMETNVGYSWLPLLENDVLRSSEHLLMVSNEKPSSTSALIKPDLQNNIENVRWIENHKELFKVYIQPVSTVHSEDIIIESFINLSSELRYLFQSDCSSVNFLRSKNALLDVVVSLDKCPVDGLIQFSSIIFDNLLWLSVNPISEVPDQIDLSQHFLHILASVVDRIANHSSRKYENLNRDAILSTYATYAACIPGCESEETILANYKRSQRQPSNVETDAYLDLSQSDLMTGLFHEDFLTKIIQCIDSGIREIFFENFWFYLQLLIRSMNEFYFVVGKQLNFDQNDNHDIFSSNFKINLSKLLKISFLKLELYSKYKDSENSGDIVFGLNVENYRKCQFLVRNVALFINDLSTMFNASIIRTYVIDFMSFMNVIISGEKYAVIRLYAACKLEFLRIISCNENFLLLNGFNYLSNVCINEKRTSQRILLDLILNDVKTNLKTSDSFLQSDASNIVWNLLASHESDQRYDSQEIRSSIAKLYLPFNEMMMDLIKSIPLLRFQPVKPSKKLHDTNFQPKPFVFDPLDEGDQLMSGDTVNVEKHPITSSTVRNLMLCFIWSLKNIGQEHLTLWLQSLPPYKIQRVLHLLLFSLLHFEYRSYKQRKSHRDSLVLSLMDLSSTDLKKPTEKSSSKALLNEQGKLCMEIVFVALDVFHSILKVSENKSNISRIVLNIFKVVIDSLGLNQSTLATHCLLAFQRMLIRKYTNIIFDEGINYCGDLCNNLLKLCASNLKEIRSHVVASLHMLMRHNFQLDNTFARIKLQITIALNKLVWDNSDSKNKKFIEMNLNRSLRTIKAYCAIEIELQNGKYNSDYDFLSFAQQVDELVLNLHSILVDTMKMSQFSKDSQMLIDIMCRIAKGYQNSPDLRLTWLIFMKNKHKVFMNDTETAMCYSHCAAIVAEYLGMKEPLPYMPVGCVDMANAVGSNLLEESAISDDVVSPDEDGVCCNELFTQEGLIKLIQKSAKYFMKAGFFELLPKLYKIILPILEEKQDYERLSLFHNEIKNAYDSIRFNSNKRIFATYFRVGFYGDSFKEMDGQEYVYKEAPFAKLHEIAGKIESFYSTQFGNDSLIIIKDSNVVNVDTLEKGKVYIQITFVEPYFETAELRRRTSIFDQNYNLKKFVFSTPYTLDGKAHGDLKSQYKRKTILVTERAFPSIKTRIRVVRKTQIELTPIEVALEDLKRKVEQLSSALEQNPVDAKYLQMMLQGSIGTTVNQGPLELANSFLTECDSRIHGFHYNKLKQCFKEFLRSCEDGLQKNESLITPDQSDYQKELKKNFHDISKQLLPLLNFSKT